jgi:hypothetical protein
MKKKKRRVKKPHYVPQSYLRQFANDEHLYVFDKTQRRRFGAHIEDVCSERAFYEFEGLEDAIGPDQGLEDLFQGFEDAGARAIRDTVGSIREGAFTELPQSQRLDLALFLAIQHLRTKRMREVTGQLMEAISKQGFIAHIRRTQPDFPIEDSWLTISADERARAAAQFWLVSDEDVRVVVAGMLNHRVWLFVHNETGDPFYTSDHPLAEHGEIGPAVESTAMAMAQTLAEKLNGKGLFRKILPSLLANLFAMPLRVVFPLSPDVVLVMLDSERFPNGASIDGRVQPMMDARDLDFYNSLQVMQAYRQVYSKDSNFALAARLVQ